METAVLTDYQAWTASRVFLDLKETPAPETPQDLEDDEENQVSREVLETLVTLVYLE